MNLTFTFSLDESNLILAALSKLPYETSSATIEKIKLQAQPQLVPPVKEEETTKD